MYFDFTNLIPTPDEEKKDFSIFIAGLTNLLKKYYIKDNIKEVIFIRDRIYTFNP